MTCWGDHGRTSASICHLLWYPCLVYKIPPTHTHTPQRAQGRSVILNLGQFCFTGWAFGNCAVKTEPGVVGGAMFSGWRSRVLPFTLQCIQRSPQHERIIQSQMNHLRLLSVKRIEESMRGQGQRSLENSSLPTLLQCNLPCVSFHFASSPPYHCNSYSLDYNFSAVYSTEVTVILHPLTPNV